MTACVCGCRIRGQHLPSCGDPTDCPCSCHTGGLDRYCDLPGGCHTEHRAAENCTGCRPVPAAPGRALCERHISRLTAALVLAPALTIHLRSIVEPGGSPEETGEQHLKSSAAPAPLNLAAVDAADLIYAQLASWVETTCGDLGLTGPTIPRGWRADSPGRQITGMRAATTGDETTALAGFLHAHLDQITTRDWSADMCRTYPHPLPPSLLHAIERAAKAFPIEDEPKYLNGQRCKNCGRATLRFTPPADAQLPSLIKCTGCGMVIPEDNFDWETLVILSDREVADRARAEFAAAAGAA